MDWSTIFRFQKGSDGVVITGLAPRCKVKYVLPKLPDSLEWIGEHAFPKCQKLAIGKLPGNLKNIGSWAFANWLEKICGDEGLDEESEEEPEEVDDEDLEEESED